MNSFEVELVRKSGESWGIIINGEAPIFVQAPNSPAEEAGVRKFDRIDSVNGCDVTKEDHEGVAELIRNSKNLMRLRLQPSIVNKKEYYEKSSVNNDEDDFQYEKIKPQIKQFTASTWYEDEKNTKEISNEQTNYCETSSEDSFDHTDYDQYCKLLKELSVDDSAFDIRPRYENKTGKVEQNNFIVTKEDQKKFDEKYDPENCVFQGGRAAVAGAFTGDHNVIRKENDVIGVHKRVFAGIQHFNQEKIVENDKGKLVAYTTSLGVYRKIKWECEEVRKLLRRYRVKFEDRDIFLKPEHKLDLYERLGLESASPLPSLPRVYIDGVFVGGFEELNSMSDCGDLRIRLKHFPKYNYRKSCTTCNKTGKVVCTSCNGKKFRNKNRFSQLKCASCRQKGEIPCNDCLPS